MSTAHDLFSQAPDLPTAHRQELARLLWDSLTVEDCPLELDLEYEAAMLRKMTGI